MRNLILFIVFCICSLKMSAQCASFDNHPKGEEYAKKLFLYRDYVSIKEYKKALPMWEELYKCCKGSSNILFAEGLEIYKHFAKYAINEEHKRTYNEKIATIYLDRIQCRKDAINKKTNTPLAGVRYYYLGIHYATKLNDYQRAFEAFEESVAIDGLKTTYKLLKPYAQVTLSEYREGRVTKERVIEIQKQLLKIANHHLNDAEDGDNYKWMKSEVETIFFKSKTGQEVFGCDYFSEEIWKDLLEHEKDLEYIKEVIRKRIREVGCDENSEIFKKVKEHYQTMIEVEIGCNIPSASTRGENCEREGDINCAIEFYKIDVENTSFNINERFYVARRLAGLYQREENWEESLKYYIKAVELNPNTGDPYLKIGMLYLRANRTCGNFERQKVANIAIDYFEKAATFEDSKSEAQEKIKEYHKYLPTKEQVFQRAMKCNQKIMAGCVLKKETRLRCR